MLQAPLRASVSGWMFWAMVLGTAASLWLPPAVGGAVAVEPSRLQADADGMIKNAEEMVAHGGMGDAKAILHHCDEAARLAETILTQLAASDSGAQDARTSLDEVIKQCRRVSEHGVHADPGVLLNPAIKARAAARASVKALGLSRGIKS
jgi:hypothetical protein